MVEISYLRKMQSKSWDLGLFGILWCWPWINSYFKYQTNCLYTLARNANANVPLQYDISHTWCPHPPTTTTQHLPWLFRDQGVKIIQLPLSRPPPRVPLQVHANYSHSHAGFITYVWYQSLKQLMLSWFYAGLVMDEMVLEIILTITYETKVSAK